LTYLNESGASVQKGAPSHGSLDIDAFVLSKEITKFFITDTHSHPGSIEIGSDIFGQLGHVGLTESLHFLIGLVKGIKVGPSDGRANVESRERIGKYGIKAQGLNDGSRNVRRKVEGTLVGTEGRGVLDAKSAIHANHPNVVHPADSELQVTFGFHQLFGNKGISGIAIENGRETLKGGLDRVNELGFVVIAAFGFSH
jgi:hypothetical protein